jgi:hypothetical protein
MKVSLDGAFYTAQGAVRIFKKQGSGNIIFTGSVSVILVNIPQKQAAVSFPFLFCSILKFTDREVWFKNTCLLNFDVTV